MIEKMKKLTFLVYHKEYESFMQELQKLGVYHIERGSLESEENANLLQRINSTQNELQTVRTIKQAMFALLGTDVVPENGDASLGKEVVEQYKAIEEALRLNKQNLEKAQQQHRQLLPWGNFDPSQLERLKEVGVNTTFHKVPASFLKVHPEYAKCVVAQDKKNLWIIVFSKDGEEAISEGTGTAIQLPDTTLSACKQSIASLQEEQKQLTSQRMELAKQQVGDLCAYEIQLMNQLSFDQAQDKTTPVAADKVMLLEGWFPQNKQTEVEKFLQSENVYYEAREAQEGDDVPIKLRNNWFTRQFEVLTGMYGVPIYQENDPTPIIAIFYSLFFAICMGDCGYGLLLILFGWGVKAGKIKGGLLDMFKGLGNIIMILGGATAIVGLLLGTFMGINLYEADWVPEGIKAIEAPFQGKIAGYSTQMVMALIIGVIHIILAMTIKAFSFTRNKGFAATISTWAWLLLFVGAIVIAILGGVQTIDEQAMKWAFIIIGIISALGIYIFNDIHRNPLINIGAGLYDTYNMASGVMGDVLSYIRLYALGLSGAMLGDTFNSLGLSLSAGDFTPYSPILWIGTAAILLFGHLLNIAMSALGAFVHPLRLTFVEYFKNVGYEGTGTKYAPFSRC